MSIPTTSTIPTPSPSSGNLDAQHVSWFPSDEDDRLLLLFGDVTLGLVIADFFLGTFVVVCSLKSLHELAHSSSSNSERQKNMKGSWITRKLKSQYATPVIIFGNGVVCLLAGIVWLCIHLYVADQVTCDILQRVLSFLYVMSLWTTYIVFEIRRISTGTENFKGIRYWIMQVVRFSTLCMPAFAIVTYLFASGIYLADAQQCMQAIDPIISVIFGVADGMLSIGHIMVFIFAIRKKSSFKVSLASSNRNRKKPAVASSPNVKRHLELMNRTLASASGHSADKIRSIARRNLRLAGITVASTAVAMVIISFGNVASPPKDSPSARSYAYLRHVSFLAAAVDALVNSLAILVMTSSWQPASLKKLSAKIGANATHRQEEEESEVSTLGGG